MAEETVCMSLLQGCYVGTILCVLDQALGTTYETPMSHRRVFRLGEMLRYNHVIPGLCRVCLLDHGISAVSGKWHDSNRSQQHHGSAVLLIWICLAHDFSLSLTGSYGSTFGSTIGLEDDAVIVSKDSVFMPANLSLVHMYGHL